MNECLANEWTGEQSDLMSQAKMSLAIALTFKNVFIFYFISCQCKGFRFIKLPSIPTFQQLSLLGVRLGTGRSQGK